MHAAQLAHTFLASSASGSTGLDAGNPVVFVGLLVGGLITLITLADKVDGMVQRRKRNPPIESEFVTKADFVHAQAKVREEFAQLQQQVRSELTITRIAIEKLTSSISKDFNTLYRALGKVEGVTLEDRDRG